MLFNGAPSFIASMQRDAAFGQIIDFLPDDDLTVRCSATGFPAAAGSYAKIAKNKEEAVPVETKDPSGRKVMIKCWYDEATNTLTSEGYNVQDKFYSTGYRSVNEDGILTLTITNTLQNGTSCSFYAKFKKLM